MGSRRCPLVSAGAMVLVAAMALTAWGIALGGASASPVRQFPTNSVTIISDPPPPDEPGQFSEATLLRENLDDSGFSNWRAPDFDDNGWQPSYPVVRRPGWGDPLGNPASAADFIWGGVPGAGPDADGRYTVPSTPAPQFLFLRKNFCIPINASVSSIAVINPLRLQVAADPGRVSVYYNTAPIATGLNGGDDGPLYTYDLNLDQTLVDSVRRVGRNTLAMRVRDDVNDANAAVAYRLQFNYSIDAGAVTLSSNPPSGSAIPGVTVTFWQSNNGLSGDGPYAFYWDFGDGTISAEPSPSKVDGYASAGTYTVTLTMTDRFGCPSAPVLMQYVVAAPTPTSTPTNTPTPTPTNTPPPPPPTNPPAPRPPSQPTSAPVVLSTPALAPTAIVPVLLPETGNTGHLSHTNPAFPIAGGILLIVVCLLLRHIVCRD